MTGHQNPRTINGVIVGGFVLREAKIEGVNLLTGRLSQFYTERNKLVREHAIVLF